MMKKLISQKKAINILISLLTAVLLFHTLVVTGVIPYAVVWAGKISTVVEMWKLEFVSISINTFSILIVMLKANYIKHKIPVKVLNAFIWLFTVFFSLNTIGNLFAKSSFEFYFFTPFTFILVVLCLRIVVDKSLNSDHTN